MRLKVHTEIGAGDQFLYAYAFPSQITGKTYPVKIGRAKRNPIGRIIAQQASMQESPEVLLLVKCQDSVALERFVHSGLMNARLPTFGREWFMTSAPELAGLVRIGIDRASMSLGDQIRAARSELGLSQRELADRAGTRQATVSKVERGNDVMLSLAQRIARAMSMELILD